MWQADLKSYAQALTRFSISGLRARLLLLVLLVIIPSLALIIYIAREQRLQGLDHAEHSTLKLAREAAYHQRRSISQARDFLSELSQYPELDRPRAKACPALLAKKLNEHPEYANLFVLSLDGELVCSAQPVTGRVNASDRVYFQLAVARKSFSVGEYQVGRVTGKPTIAFGHPVLDDTGRLTAVLAASLDLTYLRNLVNDATLPEGSSLLFIDSKGTILLRQPDLQGLIGKSMSDQPLVRRLLAAKGEEVGQEVGLDGVHRLYGFAPIRVGDDTRAYLGMGIPIEVAFADAYRTLRRNLILLGLVSLLALGAAWFGGNFFLVRPVDNLVSTTRRLASGDLGARTQLPYEKSELGQLARAFDGMAENLQRRKADIEQAKQALQDRYRELQILFQITQTVLTSSDLQTALEKILDEAVAVDSFDLGTILLVDPSGEKIEAAASRGYRDPANIERRPSEEATKWSRYRAGWYRNTTVVENVAESEGLRTLKREGIQSAVLTPVRAGEKTLGILQVGSRMPRQFDADKVRLLEAIGDQMGIAIQKSNLYEEAKRNLDRIHTLHDIDLAITSTLDLQTILDVLLEKIDLTLPYSSTTIRLFNRENGLMEPAACRNLDEQEWKTRGAVRGYTTGEIKTPLAINNIQTHPRTQTPEFFRKQGLVSCLRVPLLARDTLIGLISFYTKEEREFSNEESEFLTTMASQAAIAIYNSQLFEEIARSKKELESTNQYLEKSLRQLGGLYAALTPIDPAASMPELMGGIIERLMGATGADAALIRVWDKEAGTLPIVSHRGFSDDYLKRVETAPPGGALEWVIKNSEPIITPDIASEPRLKGKVQLQLGLRSCAMLSLNVHGEVRGILHVASDKLGYFNEEQKDHLTAIARQMSIALENRELFYSLKSSRDELHKANRVKDDFLGVVSHELRTPLNVIMGYTGLLAEGMFGELSPEQNNAAQTVMSQSKDLLSIVNHLLQATQIESGDIPVISTAVNLTGFLDELKMAYDIPTKKELTINWDYPFHLPSVETDSGKLKEILQNLIGNALKFTEKGTVSITARYIPEAKTLVLRVADTGAGIPKELVPIIFEKFRQADGSNTRAYDGVGLGLYIVKKYTELIGGEVEVKSEIGKGSTFTVTIPCETAQYSTWQDDQLEQAL